MFSGVTSSARSPSHTKMMTLRADGLPCWGAAGSLTSPSTTNDEARMNLLIFMVGLVSEMTGAASRDPSPSRRERAGVRVIQTVALDRTPPHPALSPSGGEGVRT